MSFSKTVLNNDSIQIIEAEDGKWKEHLDRFDYILGKTLKLGLVTVGAGVAISSGIAAMPIIAGAGLFYLMMSTGQGWERADAEFAANKQATLEKAQADLTHEQPRSKYRAKRPNYARKIALSIFNPFE